MNTYFCIYQDMRGQLMTYEGGAKNADEFMNVIFELEAPAHKYIHRIVLLEYAAEEFFDNFPYERHRAKVRPYNDKLWKARKADNA